jgi:hypothetical protein
MSEPERPFLPMSGELGGDFMSGMADSIRERRAREVPGWEGVVEEEEEEEWPEEEWEDDEEEWEDEVPEKLRAVLMKALGPLIDFIVDITTMATVPAALLLLVTAYQTTFGILETGLLLFGATVATLMIANTKQRLLRKLR